MRTVTSCGTINLGADELLVVDEVVGAHDTPGQPGRGSTTRS